MAGQHPALPDQLAEPLRLDRICLPVAVVEDNLQEQRAEVAVLEAAVRLTKRVWTVLPV